MKNNRITLGSLFDGSGGFPLAGALNGIEPAWASEVEPYPIAVTTSRFPCMKHLGDVSKVNGAEIEPVDIITFGSPCQDMSVAGKRAGIKHDDHGDEETTRSGLFYEAIRIIKEMRYGTEGRFPTLIVWENVPGAFSSNRGEDFRTVLEELVKIAEPTSVVPDVPKGGWAYADCWRGDGWSLAYRVFDAQHIRTAQRRKRIYLVLCLGDETGAGKILFERDRLRGDYPQSGKARERTASHAEGSLDADDREGAVIRAGGFKELNSAKARSDGFEEEVANTLSANKHDASVVIGFDGYNAADTGDKCATLGVNCGMSTGRNGVVIDRHILDDQGGSQISVRNDGKCPTLRAEAHGNVPCVVALEPGIAAREGGHIYEGVSGTLRANAGDNQMAVAYGVVYALDRASFNQGENAQYDFEITDSGVNSTIVAKGPSAVCYAIDQQGGKSGANYAENVMPTMCSDSHGTPHAVAYQEPSAVCYEGTYQKTTGPLMANSHPGSYSGQDAYQDMFVVGVATPPPRYIVRRLTPTECARLQGFPDRWGDIDHKETMTDEEFAFWLEVKQTYDRINGRAKKEYTEKQILAWYNKLHNDGAEYKMWGNGIALPCALYVMEGIVEVAT